jgi:ABC-2 type transport system permease protein
VPESDVLAPDTSQRPVGSWQQLAVIARYELLILVRERLIFVLLFVIPAVLIAVVGRGLEAGDAKRLNAGVPGFAVLFVFSLTSYAGNAFFRDVWWRSWPRTVALPCRPTSLIAGKLLPVFVIGCAQLGLLIGGAHAVLGVRLAGSLFALAVLVALTVAVACAFGVLFAALLPTTGALSQATYLLVIVGGTLGGGLTPVENLPAWVRMVGRATPQYWSIQGIQAVMSRPVGIPGVTASLSALVLILAVLAALAVWAFDLSRIASR